MANKIPPPERISQTQRELDVALTPEERADLSQELVNLLGELETEQAEQTARKAEMKERLATMEARLSRLAGTLRRGREKRLVAVEVYADWTTMTASERRLDTGREIELRPLTPDERQLKLDDDARPIGDLLAEPGEP